MTRAGWDVADMPEQRGRTFLITGVTSGLGESMAHTLAAAGARVVLAARNPAKLDETVTAVREAHPGAELERLEVDLADLASVRRAAEQAAPLGAIDVLINNAGVMAPPYQRTVDGLELQMATNHYGPFLLTGLLLPQLQASGAGRVVSVSSQMHRMADRPPLEDPRTPEDRYRRWRVYGRSKLANLLFTFELAKRAKAHGLPIEATVGHPGYAATHLLVNGQAGGSTSGLASVLHGAVRATGQSVDGGAMPVLMAATADIPSGSYCGPGRPGEMSGRPKLVGSNRLSRDPEAQRALWQLSEDTVGLTWP